MRQAQASAPLVLRNGPSVDADRCGILEKGSNVVVLEEQTLIKGVYRAQIALKAAPDQPLGWVTSFKAGSELLRMSVAEESLNGFYTSSGPRRSPRKDRSPRLPDRLLHDSMAARIAWRRHAASDRRAHINIVFETELQPQPQPTGHVPEATEATDGSSSCSKSALLKRQETVPFIQLRSSVLMAAMAELEVQAVQWDSQTFNSLPSQVAMLLARKNQKVDDLVREWDRNGDGNINKNEFRVCMRKLGLTVDVKQIDDMFDEADVNLNGELDLQEVKIALKQMQAEAQAGDTQAAQARAAAAVYRQVAAVYKTAAEITLEYERATADLEARKQVSTVDVRLGDLLAKRNVRIGDVVTKWDKDGSGSVDAKEFYLRTKELGLSADQVEIKELFGRLDGDGSGELDLEELKVSLKTLQDAAANDALSRKVQAKQVADMSKAMKTAQRAALAAKVELEQQQAEAAEEKVKIEEKVRADAAAEKLLRQAAASAKPGQSRTVLTNPA